MTIEECREHTIRGMQLFRGWDPKKLTEEQEAWVEKHAQMLFRIVRENPGIRPRAGIQRVT